MFPLLFNLAEVWGDFNLILKIFVIMTIYSWTKNNLGGGFLSSLVLGAVTFFVIFDFWKFFGGIYVLWILLMFGVSQIIIDFFFVAPRQGHEMESPVGHGGDIAARKHQIASQQQNFAQKFLRR